MPHASMPWALTALKTAEGSPESSSSRSSAPSSPCPSATILTGGEASNRKHATAIAATVDTSSKFMAEDREKSSSWNTVTGRRRCARKAPTSKQPQRKFNPQASPDALTHHHSDAQSIVGDTAEETDDAFLPSLPSAEASW
ncbi:unnamed protein product, partial [Schistocephalus solidus]